MVQTQMRAEIAGVMLPGLGHATRATGETDRGRHDVPVMRVYAWGIRTVVEEWQEQRAHTLLRSHRLPVRAVREARLSFSKSGRPERWHIVGRKRPRRLSEAQAPRQW